MQTERDTYDVAEFAAKLGIGLSTAYGHARLGVLAGVPIIRVGQRFLVPRLLADRVLRGETIEAGVS